MCTSEYRNSKASGVLFLLFFGIVFGKLHRAAVNYLKQNMTLNMTALFVTQKHTITVSKQYKKKEIAVALILF